MGKPKQGRKNKPSGIAAYAMGKGSHLKIYRVKDWNEKYEIAQSRHYTNLKWVAIPNTHNGNGYAALCQHPQAVELFAAFILIVEVASMQKKEHRGTLISDSGRPITAKQLAFITHFPVKIFDLAFEELIKEEIGWLEVVTR